MSRQMIFDTQGTGFDTRFIREMAEQPEIGYLGGGLGGGLGDEVMLLEGLDDLGEQYPRGYSAGPASRYTMPTTDPATHYDFAGSVESRGVGESRLGSPIGSAVRGGWPAPSGVGALGADPWKRTSGYRYTGLKGLGRADYRYTGLGAQRERQGGAWARSQGYKYTGLRGLGKVDYRYTGLGDAASDRASALAVATTVRDIGLAACGALTDAGAQSGCRAGVNGAFLVAQTAINAATTGPSATGTSTTAPTCDAACIQNKLDQIARSQTTQSAAVVPPGTYREPPADNTQMYVIGGIAVVALLAGLYIMKS